MRARSALFLLSLGAVIACGGAGTDGASTSTSGTEPPTQCDAGSRPSLDGTCAPVGPTQCADGFVRSSSGWGCEAIVPTSACTGATRAAIGQTSCVAVDDCSAPFPPAGATVVTDSASLAAALASARPGATLALDAGQYAPITLRQDIKLVGRCADKVIVTGGGDRGIWVQGDVKVSLRSMTVTGFSGGLSIAYGPTVDASNLVVSNNTIGVVAGEASITLADSVIEGAPATKDTVPDDTAATAMIGGKITLQGVDVRDTKAALAAYDEQSAITAKRSVITYDGPSKNTDLMQAFRGGAIDVEESTVRTRESRLIYLGNNLPDVPGKGTQYGGTARFASSELAQVDYSRSDDGLALVAAGGKLTLEDTTLVHQSGLAILLGERGAAASLTSSVIRGVPNGDEMRAAIMALHGATADLTNTAIVSSWQNALLAADGSSMSLTSSLVSGTKFGGPGPNAKLGGAAMAIGVSHQASLSLADSAVVGSDQFGVLLGDGSTLDMQGSLVDGTALSDAPLGGIAIGASAGSAVSIDGSVVRGSGDAALFFDGGQGVAQNSRFIANKVGVHLQGTALVEAKAPRDAGEGELVLFRDSFEKTDTYTRTSPLTLPAWE